MPFGPNTYALAVRTHSLSTGRQGSWHGPPLGQARRRRLCATQTRFWLRNQSSWFGGRQLASRTAGGGL